MSIYTTERLDVRPWSYDDVDAAYAIYSVPEMVRYLGNPEPHASPDVTRAWIDRINERAHGLADGHGFWAVHSRDTDALVGAVICAPLPGDDRIEIGWHVGPAYQGRGYATEFTRGLLDYARSHGITTVYAVIVAANTPSLNVARKLGMTPLGPTDRYYDRTLELFELTL